MKKLFFLMVACLVATTASAQFVSSGSGNARNTASSGNFFGQMSTDDYNRFYVGYNPTKIKWDDSDYEEEFPMSSSLSVGYLHASSLSSQFPLFLEYGANFQYSFGKETDSYEDDYYEDEYDIEWGMNMYSVNVPVNLALKLQFNDCALTPYLGLNFRVNIAGSYKISGEGEEESVNIFSKSDMEDWYDTDKVTAKRFQAGINFGVGFNYKSLYLGVGYTSDFSKIFNYSDADFVGKIGVTSLTVGFNF
ncbi:MAG: hypothetical protein IIY05_06465 [Alistipes sp.]|nr:hypothetical protein [Alistipes sp.]